MKPPKKTRPSLRIAKPETMLTAVLGGIVDAIKSHASPSRSQLSDDEMNQAVMACLTMASTLTFGVCGLTFEEEDMRRAIQGALGAIADVADQVQARTK